MKLALIVVLVATLTLGGCAGLSTTEQRVLSGGAIGASGGALIGWAAGSPAVGAAVGAGAGALGGYLYDRYQRGRLLP
jgi:osmotically inducible lipoprotein OsmB